jgi:hypothetical protein
MDDSDYLRLLTHQAEQANEFLSNARKWERERWVCQRLLQALNVSHRIEEFTAAEQEPPDVVFREASFEVFFVLDEGRRLTEIANHPVLSDQPVKGLEKIPGSQPFHPCHDQIPSFHPALLLDRAPISRPDADEL